LFINNISIHRVVCSISFFQWPEILNLEQA